MQDGVLRNVLSGTAFRAIVSFTKTAFDAGYDSSSTVQVHAYLFKNEFSHLVLVLRLHQSPNLDLPGFCSRN